MGGGLDIKNIRRKKKEKRGGGSGGGGEVGVGGVGGNQSCKFTANCSEVVDDYKNIPKSIQIPLKTVSEENVKW